MYGDRESQRIREMAFAAAVAVAKPGVEHETLIFVATAFESFLRFAKTSGKGC